MSTNLVAPLVRKFDPKVNNLLSLVQEQVARGEWARSYRTLNHANKLLRPILKGLVMAGGFAAIHGNISPKFMKNVSLLDAVNPKAFEPRLVHPNVRLECAWHAQNYIAKDPEAEIGSTFQFLSYLARNPSAGLEFSIAHLQSVGYSANGNEACLYVKQYHQGERELSLANLYGFERGPDWQYFAVRRV